MDISSKIAVRILVAGVTALSLSGLSSQVFAVPDPAPKSCAITYNQATAGANQTLAATLKSCYQNRSAESYN
jgi:hypothetical protein